MNTRFHAPLVASIAVSCMVFAGFATPADAADEKWRFRLAAALMSQGSGTVETTDNNETYVFNGDTGTGFAIEFEYMASRRLGVDFGVISAAPGIEVSVGEEPFTITAGADLRVTPIFAALNIHLTPDRPFDLYIGPMLAYVVYEGFNLSATPGLSEEFSAENEFALGAVLGLDIALGKSGWSLSSAIRYLETTLEARPQDGDFGKADIDPIIFSVGVGYRF